MNDDVFLPHGPTVTAPLDELAREVEEKITAWSTAGRDCDWGELAIRLMHAQRREVPTYGAWCELDDAWRQTLKRGEALSWSDVPALPIAAFKQHRVASARVDAACWHSSGTTGAQTSRHHLHDTRCYDASLEAGVRRALLANATPRIAVVQLAPSSVEAPHSSLSHMLDHVRTGMGLVDAGSYVDAAFAVDVDDAWDTLTSLAQRGEPVLVLATSFALVALLDATADRAPLQLSTDSRVMDTGGTKGRVRDITRAQIVELVERRLGVPAARCENEYGMSELSSQAWLGHFVTGHAASRSRWQPPWMLTRVVDPVSLRDVPDGQTGLLVHHDLANVWSCAAIRSEDLGVRVGDGWQLVGRAPGAQIRGCSLQLEDLLLTTAEGT